MDVSSRADHQHDRHRRSETTEEQRIADAVHW
jgi:hypothetical protein